MTPTHQHTKGLIFALDAAIAVTVVIIILINSSYYFTTSSRESISQLQLAKIGSDVLAFLDNTGALERAALNDYTHPAPYAKVNDTIINVSLYLPKNYAMRVELSDINETLLGDTNLTIGASFTIPTPSIELAPRRYLIAANISLPPTVPASKLQIKNLNTQSESSAALPVYNGINLFYEAVGVGVGILFNQGVNTLQFSVPIGAASAVTLHWFRVLGAKPYYGSTPISPPTDTFIGTGERIFFVNNTLNYDIVRIARFSIWLQ